MRVCGFDRLAVHRELERAGATSPPTPGCRIDPGAEPLGLFLHARHQLVAINTFGEAGVVLNGGCRGQQPAGLAAGQDERLELGPRRIQRGGQAGATRADDDHFFHRQAQGRFRSAPLVKLEWNRTAFGAGQVFDGLAPGAELASAHDTNLLAKCVGCRRLACVPGWPGGPGGPVPQEPDAGAPHPRGGAEDLQDGKAVKTAAYGLANLELNVPAKPETVFEIGSITKQFTAAGILLLAQEGKLSVDDRISKHLKDTPEAWSNVTIRHLLTHTSGIKSYTGLNGFQIWRHLTQAQFIKAIGKEPMEFQPGDSWKYCNTGFNLLGYIIENVSGQELLGVHGRTHLPTAGDARDHQPPAEPDHPESRRRLRADEPRVDQPGLRSDRSVFRRGHRFHGGRPGQMERGPGRRTPPRPPPAKRRCGRRSN